MDIKDVLDTLTRLDRSADSVILCYTVNGKTVKENHPHPASEALIVAGIIDSLGGTITAIFRHDS